MKKFIITFHFLEWYLWPEVQNNGYVTDKGFKHVYYVLDFLIFNIEIIYTKKQ